VFSSLFSITLPNIEKYFSEIYFSRNLFSKKKQFSCKQTNPSFLFVLLCFLFYFGRWETLGVWDLQTVGHLSWCTDLRKRVLDGPIRIYLDKLAWFYLCAKGYTATQEWYWIITYLLQGRNHLKSVLSLCRIWPSRTFTKFLWRYIAIAIIIHSPLLPRSVGACGHIAYSHTTGSSIMICLEANLTCTFVFHFFCLFPCLGDTGGHSFVGHEAIHSIRCNVFVMIDSYEVSCSIQQYFYSIMVLLWYAFCISWCHTIQIA